MSDRGRMLDRTEMVPGRTQTPRADHGETFGLRPASADLVEPSQVRPLPEAHAQQPPEPVAPPPPSEYRPPATAKIIGRYALYDEFAAGGMASLHFGRLYGSAGFARTVAIKRLHSNLAGEAEFVSMLVDEARLAARIRHPNVVPTLDVVSSDGELLLVMEYVHGLSLAQLLQAGSETRTPCPPTIAMAIACDMLRGLHAAHEARSETGEALELVHRDVSPQNIIVGVDGAARVVDFGVAKAAGRIQETRDGELKGKIPYMAPEQLKGDPATRRCDVYGAGVVLWEALTGRRLFRGDNDASVWLRVLNDPVKRPGAFVRGIPWELDDIVLAAVAKDPQQRVPTALEMAKRIEAVAPLATPLEVGAWVEDLGRSVLSRRAAMLARVEHAAAPSEPLVAEMVQPEKPASRWSIRRGGAIAGVLLAGAIAFTITTFALRHDAEEEAPTVTPATATEQAAPAPETPVAAKATEPAPPPPTAATETAPPQGPDETLEIVPPKAKSGTPTPITHRGRSQKVQAAVPKPPAASCDPPFIIDANGRKQYKEQCL